MAPPSYMNLPAVPDTFEWVDTSWGAVLRCTPLLEIAPHLFTTRQLALTSADDWARLAAALGAGSVQMLTQVHGKHVVAIGNRQSASDSRQSAHGNRPGGDSDSAPWPQGDALVSDHPDVAIAVRAADCVPILLADPNTRAVAAVHAGWRGTTAGVTGATVAALEREFGAKASALVAAIGPSIGPCCYEVGTELVDAFAAAGHGRHLVERWFIAPPLRRGEFPASPSGAAGKLRLDTWAATRDQLLLAGLDEQNIHLCGLCTASHIEWFPSYRVEREKAGRIAGAIRAAER